MRKLIAFVLVLTGFAAFGQQPDSTMIAKVYTEALASSESYDHLRYLCKEIGHRLSGSSSLDEAIAWGAEVLKNYGADSVYLQPVVVPHWSRGTTAEASYTSGLKTGALHITALGGSIPTNGVVEGEVIEVKHIEELEKLGRKAIEGKIVLFNRAMDPLLINTGAAYGGAYDQRSDGASAAGAYGAKAVLVRSLTHAQDTFPHTGGMEYKAGVDQIPAAAISTVDANLLHTLLSEGERVHVQMEMDCIKYEDREQANVIAEWRGEEIPEEIIVLGGHLDSWDIGEGAHDDGAGIAHTIEVLRLLKAMNYKPRRTLRFVLFINEENGNNGGETYAEVAKQRGEIHHAAIESDAGGFTPRGYNTECGDELYSKLRHFVSDLEDYGIHQARRGWSGVDIRPLKDQTTNLFGFIPDGQRYFDYHHSNRDVFEMVNPRELALGSASLAVLMVFLDMQ
ncbi:MAG: hypothetical protein RL226_429 [Bacteroidota bacterium]